MKTLFLLLTFLMTSVIADEFNPPSDSSYVAWKTRKRMFLFKEVIPIGVSKNINIKKSVNNDFTIIIPKDSFDSGDSDRDKEVVLILKGKKNPNIEFNFNLSKLDIINLKSGDLKNIKGKLNATDSPIDVTFSISINKDNKEAIDVKYEGSFSHFGIKPPKVAGGAVAKVYDELTLMGTILFSDLMI